MIPNVCHLVISSFSLGHLNSSFHSLVVTMYGLILLTIQSLLYLCFTITYFNSSLLFGHYLHMVYVKPLVAPDQSLGTPFSN